MSEDRPDCQIWISKEMFKKLLDAQYHLAVDGKVPSKKECVEDALTMWIRSLNMPSVMPK